MDLRAGLGGGLVCSRRGATQGAGTDFRAKNPSGGAFGSVALPGKPEVRAHQALGSGGARVADSKLLETIANAIRAEAENTRNASIDANTRLVEDLGLDSIDIVGVTMRLEDRFRIEIGVEDIKHFRSVRDLMDQVSLCLGKSAA